MSSLTISTSYLPPSNARIIVFLRVSDCQDALSKHISTQTIPLNALRPNNTLRQGNVFLMRSSLCCSHTVRQRFPVRKIRYSIALSEATRNRKPVITIAPATYGSDPMIALLTSSNLRHSFHSAVSWYAESELVRIHRDHSSIHGTLHRLDHRDHL